MANEIFLNEIEDDVLTSDAYEKGITLLLDNFDPTALIFFELFKTEEQEKQLIAMVIAEGNNRNTEILKYRKITHNRISRVFQEIQNYKDSIRNYLSASKEYRERAKQEKIGMKIKMAHSEKLKTGLIEWLLENPLSMEAQVFLCLNTATTEHGIKTNLSKSLTKIGKLAAKAKLKKDPKQQEKQFIKECWQNWQAEKSQYKSKAAFARDMLEKVENLTSAKKVEDWCREWEKETTTQPVQ